MRAPFFVPTSFGPVSAFADLPDRGDLRSPCVILLPGGRAGQDFLRKTATALGDEGRPALRFDYPGTGFSPHPEPFSHRDLVELVAQVSRWWREETGVESVALVGRCLGARIALWLAAREPSVSRTVAITTPVRDHGVARRMIQGIKAVDARGPNLAARLVRGPRVRPAAESRNDADFDVVSDIVGAARSSRLLFVYGSDDPTYEDLQELIETGTLPPDVVESFDILRLGEVELHGLPNVIDDDELREVTLSALVDVGEEGAGRGE